jgi:hypothetical protein
MLTLPVGTQARPHRTAAQAQQLEIAHQQATSPNDLDPEEETSDNFVLCLKNLPGSGEGTVIGHVRCHVTVRNQGLDGAELTFSSLTLIRISAQPTAND